MILDEVLRPSRHLVATLSGFVAAFIPNDKSNINPFLMGVIVAFLVTKVVIGDYDAGYKWTLSDIVFVIVTSAEGILGVVLGRAFSKNP